MEKANRHKGVWRSVVSVCLALLVVAADQLVKRWIRSNLAIGETLFDWGFFRIIHIYNTGAAFGILKDQTLLLSLIAIASVLVVLILSFVLRDRWPFLDSWLAMSGIGLIMGGTIGNLIDRLTNSGRVTDFLDFKVWPAFNVADAAVTCGEVIIIYRLITMALKPEEEK